MDINPATIVDTDCNTIYSDNKGIYKLYSNINKQIVFILDYKSKKSIAFLSNKLL